MRASDDEGLLGPENIRKISLGKKYGDVLLVQWEYRSGESSSCEFGVADRKRAEQFLNESVFALFDYIKSKFNLKEKKYEDLRSWIQGRVDRFDWGDLVDFSVSDVENRWIFSRNVLGATKDSGVVAAGRRQSPSVSGGHPLVSKHGRPPFSHSGEGVDGADRLRVVWGEVDKHNKEVGGLKSAVGGLSRTIDSVRNELLDVCDKLGDRIETLAGSAVGQRVVGVEVDVLGRVESLEGDVRSFRSKLDKVVSSVGGIEKKLDSLVGSDQKMKRRLRELDKPLGGDKQLVADLAKLRADLGDLDRRSAGSLSELDEHRARLELDIGHLKMSLTGLDEDPLIVVVSRDLGRLEEKRKDLSDKLGRRRRDFTKAILLVEKLEKAVGKETEDDSVVHEAFEKLESLSSRLEEMSSISAKGKGSPFRDVAQMLIMRDFLERSEDEIRLTLDQGVLAESVRYVLRDVDFAVCQSDTGLSLDDPKIAKPAEKLLELAGLTQILPKPGDRLQVRLHEMAAEERSREARGRIVSVRQRGLMKDDKVLFKAQVVVSMGR